MAPLTRENDRERSLNERVTIVEVEQERTSHALFGNGQPGAIQRMEARMQALEDKIGKLVIAVVALAAIAGGGEVAGILKALLGVAGPG